MPPQTNLTETLAHWQELDRQTRSLEDALLLQVREHLRGNGPPPTREDFRQIERIRGLAQEALSCLLEDLSSSP